MVHILVIDDNPTDRLLVKRELERQFSQLQITEISDDRLFGEALNRGGFHLVITDYQLRWTNGLDVLQTIKASYPECPIVMFTNTGNEEIAVEAMKSGLDDYIIKSPKHYVRLCVTVRAVLDRVAAWERVARLENQLHSLLEHLNVGVFRATSEGQLLESNQAFLRLFDASNLADVQGIYLQQLFVQPLDSGRAVSGQPRGDCPYGKPGFCRGGAPVPAQPIDEGVGVSDIGALHEGLPVQDNETALLDSGEPRSQNIEITFPLADGRVKWIRFTQYLYSAEGESTIEGLVEDITELKQAELALREFNETLEERVRERTAELEEVNAQLESFTYSVSHDLRAPLRGISFFAEMLLKDKASELDATAQDYLYRINDAASLMNTLIENLLEYSRLSKANLPLKAVSLHLIVARSIAQLEAEIAQKQARITVVEPLPTVLAHPATLLQVLANLLSNAIKFVQPGIEPQVRVYAEAEEEYIYLWVEDNGIGIAERFQERIFGLFDRLHGQEVYPGTGIGLAIASKGVDRMGGAIGVKSTLGIGTSFWVKLRKCES